MDKFQGFMLLLLLLISVSTSPLPLAMAARPISPLPDQQIAGNSNVFALLGVVCKCCNGTGAFDIDQAIDEVCDGKA
ncbi:hypothetical protein V6N11_033223 [Hibiscus sabdariffa]|uniref:Uncharacterized protein n=1 Tax=Hibiscus sabdariffa TaxID=183260 RepID=A0ABR2PXJ3_9ROSI